MLKWRSNGETECGRYGVREACWYFGRDERGNMPYMGRAEDPKAACEAHARAAQAAPPT